MILIQKGKNWTNYIVNFFYLLSILKNIVLLSYSMAKTKLEVKLVSAYRPHMKIIGDILSTARDDLDSEEGATVTYLIRKANVSHVRISKILNNLVSQGLLEQVDSQGAFRYKISSNGREFLVAYQTFSRFAENFGLLI